MYNLFLFFNEQVSAKTENQVTLSPQIGAAERHCKLLGYCRRFRMDSCN